MNGDSLRREPLPRVNPYSLLSNELKASWNRVDGVGGIFGDAAEDVVQDFHINTHATPTL